MVLVNRFWRWLLTLLLEVGLRAGRRLYEEDSGNRELSRDLDQIDRDAESSLKEYKSLVRDALESDLLSEDEVNEILVHAARDLVSISGGVRKSAQGA